jgi:hypothetical protein
LGRPVSARSVDSEHNCIRRHQTSRAKPLSPGRHSLRAQRATLRIAQCQYSQAGGATFGYDANGNLTSDGSRGYSYDVENRLTCNYGK